MTDRPDQGILPRLPVRLLLSRIGTRAAMIAERIWPLVLPLVLVAGLFVSLSWFGLMARLSDWPRIAVMSAFALAALIALWPLRFFRLPSAAEVDRRTEVANGLAHNPLQALTDRPSGTQTAFSEALWREHQKRMAGGLGNLGAALPVSSVPDRDPWGLRAVVALLMFVSYAFSLGPMGGSIIDGFRPTAAREALTARIDAWVTPPAYTGKAPMFLNADANRAVSLFTVPAGSAVSLRVTGGSGSATLGFIPANGEEVVIGPASPATEDAKEPGVPVVEGVKQFAGRLSQNGALVLRSGRSEIARWSFAVTPDTPPAIRFAGEPKRAANGTLELQYEIGDDYGAASASVEFARAEQPDANARPLYEPPEMTLNLPRRGSKANAAKTSKNLTDHIWAGVPVTLTLVATDDAGQTGRSETVTMTMPERTFANPLALAVIEQRRLLGLDANAKHRVLDLMDAVTLRPEDTFDSPTDYLALMSARTRLRLASGDDQLRDVVSYLWQVALGIEDGSLSDAEQRLRQAQQALQDALQNGASDEEIARLMEELRQAMNDFLREFAQRNQNQNNAQAPQNGQELRQSDLDRMMDQIENLARSGNSEQAQELLSQLQDMMNNLQMAQPGQQGQGQQGGDEFSQQMNKLGDIMRRQQEMMNETFRMDQMQRGDNGRMGEDQGQMGDDQQEGLDGNRNQRGQGGMTADELADALRQLQEEQGRLQKDLKQLGKDLEGMGMQPNDGFGQADKSMGQAGESLSEGEGDRAVGHQGRALEALRQGARDMMQQLQAMQGEDGQQGHGQRQQRADRDPLGRPRGTQGPDFGNSVKVPDEIDVQRAREILDAIRKRLGEAMSPEVERSYLERLLELK